MKKWILGLLLTTSSVFAAEVMILDEWHGYNHPDYVWGEFVVKNGVAKVELAFDAPASDSPASYHQFDVEGLTFDGANISYHETVCAVKTGRKIRETGNCEFKTLVEGRRLRTYMIVK